MAGPYLSAQSFLGLGKETTRGTAVAATIFVPISPNPTLTPQQTWVKDDSLRGSPVDLYNDVPTTRHDEFDCKGFVFADTFPVLMLSALGGPDTITGTTTYTHTIPLLNTASTGSQPPSYTVVDVDQVVESTDAAKSMAGSLVSELEITGAATGALNWTAKWLGNPYTEVTTPTASFSTEVLIPAYNTTVTLADDTAPVEEFKITLNRKTEPIFTLGQQGPYVVFDGPIDVTGSATFVVLSGDTTMVDGLTYEKQVCTFKSIDPISSHYVEFQMSQVQFTNPKIVRSKPYVEVSVDFSAEANTTDAASGYSPLKFTALNAQSTAY